MTFDLTQPIAFELAEASLERAAEWQALIHQLMTETDTFLVTSVRDGDEIPRSQWRAGHYVVTHC